MIKDKIPTERKPKQKKRKTRKIEDPMGSASWQDLLSTTAARPQHKTMDLDKKRERKMEAEKKLLQLMSQSSSVDNDASKSSPPREKDGGKQLPFRQKIEAQSLANESEGESESTWTDSLGDGASSVDEDSTVGKPTVPEKFQKYLLPQENTEWSDDDENYYKVKYQKYFTGEEMDTVPSKHNIKSIRTPKLKSALLGTDDLNLLNDMLGGEDASQSEDVESRITEDKSKESDDLLYSDKDSPRTLGESTIDNTPVSGQQKGVIESPRSLVQDEGVQTEVERSIKKARIESVDEANTNGDIESALVREAEHDNFLNQGKKETAFSMLCKGILLVIIIGASFVPFLILFFPQDES